MSKTTKIVLACFAGLLLLCCGGGAFLVMSGVNAYKGLGADTVKAGDEAVSAICTNWDVQQLLDRSDPVMLKTPRTEEDAIFKAWQSMYGSYRSGVGSMTSFNSNAATSTGRTTWSTYENAAKFEKCDATVTIVFKRNDPGPWKVYSFNIVRR